MTEHSSPLSSADRGDAVAVREARSEDLDPLQRIETAAFASDRISRRSMRALIGSRSCDILVAVRGGRPVGYSLVLRRRGSRVARLYSLAVSPEAAGSGIGRLLLAAAENAASVAGAEYLRLEVRADNAAAARLYVASGYRPLGTREDYYADGQSAQRYERRLHGAFAAEAA